MSDESSPEAIVVDDDPIVIPKRRAWLPPMFVIGATGVALGWNYSGLRLYSDDPEMFVFVAAAATSVFIGSWLSGVFGRIGMDRVMPFGAMVGVLTAIWFGGVLGVVRDDYSSDVVFSALFSGFFFSFGLAPLACGGAALGCVMRRRFGDHADEDDLADML